MVEKTKAKVKPKNSLAIVIIVCALVVLLIFILLRNSIYTGNVTNYTDNVISDKNCYDKNVSYDKQVETVEYYTETVPYTEEVCNQENLAYKVENFVMNSNTCSDYDELCREENWLGICIDKITFCVDKTITCSLDLTNLDNEEQGTWAIQITFYDVNNRETVDTKEGSASLYPQSTRNLVYSSNIQSTNPEGNANKEISCSYTLTSLAKKTVCEEVTKYKDVQREKVVTKPVTEYRIERVCE